MSTPEPRPKLVFRLYITEHAPSSTRALENLQAICQSYFDSNYQLEIIDTMADPLRAVRDGVVVTPTLVKVSPEPAWSVVGDLSEDARVLASIQGAPLSAHTR